MIFEVDFIDHEVEVIVEVFELIFECLVLFSLFLYEFEPVIMSLWVHVRDFVLISVDGFLNGVYIGELLWSELGFGFGELLKDSGLLCGSRLVHVL